MHCSAGVGRTGTFCAVHGALEWFKSQLDAGEMPARVNLIEAVKAMRARRPGMIQTKEQYVFAYLSVLEWTEQLLFDRGLLGDEEEAAGAYEGADEGAEAEEYYDEGGEEEEEELDQYV